MLGIASFYLCCLHEPQSLGCREFRGNHHPAFQVRCSAVCSRGGPGADALCRLPTSAVHHRHQGRARADPSPARTRIATGSCASEGSPSRRRRKSSRPCCMKKVTRQQACLISCRGSPRLPVARRIRTRDLNWRDGRSDCWNAPQNSPAAQPETGCTAGACRG
jgi:hypothetical protein